MKKRSAIGYILRISLTLLLITGVVAALLAGVNALTKDKIANANQEKTRKAIAEVLPGAGDVEEISFTDETGLVSKVYRPKSGAAGYAVEVIPSGFGGEITMMVGIGNDGNVLGISIISHTETAGLGAVAAADNAAGQAFRNQFAGMGGQLSVNKDGGQVDALTGATITSRAIVDGVNAAVACVAALP